MTGVVAARVPAARVPAARVLDLAGVTERGHALSAVQAGAAGYLYKDADPQALAQAIRAVHDGHVLVAPDVAGPMPRPGPADDDRGPATLTEREREVLVQIARGRFDREIAGPCPSRRIRSGRTSVICS